MISPEDAIQEILKVSPVLDVETVDLSKCAGRVLAEDIFSPIDMPPFDRSAMDGFAVSTLAGGQQLKLIGEHKAGDAAMYTPDNNGTVQVFTGAIVPGNTVAVVRQEDTKLEGDNVTIMLPSIENGSNIRRKGEQIKKGEVAVRKGTRMTPGVIGYLATLGVTEVSVSRFPKVTIVTTGSELITPGNELQPGQIYESNSFMLKTAVEREGVPVEVIRVVDDREQTKAILRKALDQSDLVLVTGGISVGKYDFVREVLHELNVRDLFYKVAQKPGKPLYAGAKDDKMVFGLPGNPAAALTCFYMYVIPGIRSMQAHRSPQLIRATAKLSHDFDLKGSLRNHLKGKFEGGSVQIFPRQSSAMLGDFTDANCIVILTRGMNKWQKGDSVTVMILPN